MNFNYIEENIIFEYWKTLSRKNISNIQNNKFIKKPYLENYIIKLSVNLENNNLIKKILNLININKITNEELFLFINNNIDLENDNKKKIELYFFNNISDENFNKLAVQIIIFQIKYFRFYITITELLFDCDIENNELYNFILIYIKNNNNEITEYCKKNIKFNIFNNYLNDLFLNFKNLFNLLIKYKLFEKSIEKNEILNLFLKNLFLNWYNIYKKDIIENKINDKIKNFTLKKNLLSTILCMPNI
jgi:hypothetical protein